SDHARPPACVVFARLGQIRQSAVRHLDLSSLLGRREFPAHHVADRSVFVKVCEPTVNQQPWRIDLQDLSFVIERRNTVVGMRFLVGFERGVPFAADSRIEMPAFARTFLAVPPLYELLWVR